MTTNKKFLMLLMAAATMAPAAVSASPANGRTVINKAPLNDKAPVNNNVTPARLKRTDEEQPGHEMAAFWLPTGQTKGYYFVASTELNGQAAFRRTQGAMIPVQLKQNPDGSVYGDPISTEAQFITRNDGNEYRNALNMTIHEVKGFNGDPYAVVMYNYRPNNENNTVNYIQIIDKNGQPVSINGKAITSDLQTRQARFVAHNNDDCSMHQDGDAFDSVVAAPNVTKLAVYTGCNGNGNDNGWVQINTLTFTAANAVTVTKDFDVTVANREERSRGAVRFMADGKTVLASWTEGNTQPQRDGTWLAAIKTDIGAQGNDQRQTIAWKQQVGGRVDQDGIRTYSMRMKMGPITDAAGKFNDDHFIQWGDVRGNNNTNGKGGSYVRNNLAVIHATRDGVTFKVNPVDMSAPGGPMDGIDGTHLGSVTGQLGTVGATQPSMVFLSGGHFGGGKASEARVVSFDGTKFTAGGSLAGAPHDRHLYPNYLGNNPGNQGRNHSHMQIIANPFPGSKSPQLMVMATTAKDTGDGGAAGATASQEMDASIKLAAWLTIVPVQNAPAGGGNPDPNPNPNPNPNPTPDPENPDQSGDSLGGCSAGGSAGGLAGLALVGLAASLRRRRR